MRYTHQVRDTLLYHVLGSEVKASQAIAADSATTLQGGDMQLPVIDTVLTPPQDADS